MLEGTANSTVVTSMFGSPSLHSRWEILHKTVCDLQVNGRGSTGWESCIGKFMIGGPVVEASRATDSNE